MDLRKHRITPMHSYEKCRQVSNNSTLPTVLLSGTKAPNALRARFVLRACDATRRFDRWFLENHLSFRLDQKKKKGVYYIDHTKMEIVAIWYLKF